MNDAIANKIVERISAKAHAATLARMEARNRELQAMSHKQLLAEKRRLMTHARSLGLDPDAMLS